MATRATTKKRTAKKTPTTKKANSRSAATKRTSRKATAEVPPERRYLRRDDLGAPADAFFERHPPERREHLEALRALVKKAVPGARESIKWGMPYYELKSGFCALYTSDTYAALNLMAPPEKLDDPQGRLEGKGKTMRHLKVRSAADIDEASIVRWVKTAAAHHS